MFKNLKHRKVLMKWGKNANSNHKKHDKSNKVVEKTRIRSHLINISWNGFELTALWTWHHSVEKRKIQIFSSNQLFCNFFFNENVIFTKFLPKKSESKFQHFHTVHCLDFTKYFSSESKLFVFPHCQLISQKNY